MYKNHCIFYNEYLYDIFSQFLSTQYINHDLQVTLQRIQVTNEHTKSKIKQLTEVNEYGL